METQLKKGMLDACVLSVINKEDSYGYKIAQEAMKVIEVSESTLYPVLRRLEASGSLETYNVEHNGRLRKYYKITPSGKTKLAQFKAEWIKTKRIIDFILCEEDKI
jgi:PadR family transcriptional regulator, regulatory protein PadR